MGDGTSVEKGRQHFERMLKPIPPNSDLNNHYRDDVLFHCARRIRELVSNGHVTWNELGFTDEDVEARLAPAKAHVAVCERWKNIPVALSGPADSRQLAYLQRIGFLGLESLYRSGYFDEHFRRLEVEKCLDLDDGGCYSL